MADKIEFEVTMRFKVDVDYFYWNLGTIDRQDIMSETILNAMYDMDDIKVSGVTTEEIEV